MYRGRFQSLVFRFWFLLLLHQHLCGNVFWEATPSGEHCRSFLHLYGVKKHKWLWDKMAVSKAIILVGWPVPEDRRRGVAFTVLGLNWCLFFSFQCPALTKRAHSDPYSYYSSEQKHRCVQKIQMWDGNVTNLQMITHLAKLSDLYSVQS